MSAPKNLYLIDAMGFVFRAFYAPMPMRMSGPGGVPTNVPFLFAGMVRKLFSSRDVQSVAVVFDPPGPVFRDALFAEYKAQRTPMPEDLLAQIPYVKRLCEAMRLPLLEIRGYEADDVIGTLAARAAEAGAEVFIVTADKDMLQLVRDPAPPAAGVRVLRTGARGGEEKLLDARGVEELLGLPPQKVVDYMALLGDSIDNIPGAKGIGEKGALELIRTYGSVESALDHAAEVKNKRYREALQQQREQVLLSKKLAALSTDIPVPFDLAALARREPDADALRALYTELGFSSLLKELAGAPRAADASHEAGGTQPRTEAAASAASGEATSFEHAEISSAAELTKFLAAIPAGQPAAVVLRVAESEEGEPGFGTRLAAVEICAAQRACTVPAMWEMPAARPPEKTTAGATAGLAFDVPQHPPAANADSEALRDGLRAWLADAGREKIVEDPKLIELILGPVAGVGHATALYSYLLRPTTAKHSVEEIAPRHLNTTLSGAPGERAAALLRAAPILRREIERAGLAQLYEKMDLPMAGVLARVERAGVRVDPQALATMSAALEKEARSIEARVWELAGEQFNINSPAQLAEILFDKLNLQPPVRRGSPRGKQRSTAADVLESLAPLHEIAQRVLEFREAAKLKSTYAEALPKLIRPDTGRIHTRLSQTATATGRLSSSDPNLQNIPVRSELGRQIRAAFVAPPGGMMLSADYSQIELRLLAHFSGDEVLIDSFRRGEDIHARTAQEVFGVGPLAQTADHRRIAKVINFGIIYGLSAFGLSQQLGIAQKEAAEFIARYFARYPGVRKYLEGSVEAARASGVSRTLFGRIRPIPEITAKQPALRSFAERTALNTPLQGTAADLIKLAMIEIDRRLTEEGARGKNSPLADARMILQVHDELLFECPAGALDALRGLVKPAMENVQPFEGKLAVPLLVEMKAGHNWRDMK